MGATTWTRTRSDVSQEMGALGRAESIESLHLPKAIAEARHPSPAIHFGVQLNAFPIDPKDFQSFLDVLAQVKQVGYHGFESSFRNVAQVFDDPAPARRSIEQTGLAFFGVHVFFPDELYDKSTKIAAPAVYEPIARGAAALGAKHLILSGAPATNPDQLKAKIEGLNAAGQYAQRMGITAVYHNERGLIEEIEALYMRTEPLLAHFLFDAGHACRGGANVPAFIRAHSKRIIGFHLRDLKNGRLVTLGTGTFPLTQVAHTIEQIGWKGWVENEEERDNHTQLGAEVIRPAFKAMKEAFQI